jgi:hypothetical protein
VSGDVGSATDFSFSELTVVNCVDDKRSPCRTEHKYCHPDPHELLYYDMLSPQEMQKYRQYQQHINLRRQQEHQRKWTSKLKRIGKISIYAFAIFRVSEEKITTQKQNAG